MKQSTESRDSARGKAISDMTDKALRNYEQLVRTGLKLQEEASRCWTNLLTETLSAHDFQKPVSHLNYVANGILPGAQKHMQEALSLVESSSRAGVELMKKAADAIQAPGIAESQSRWMDFWNSSVGLARKTSQELLQMNSRALDTWIDFVQKNTEAGQARFSKTA
jgi:hypothetical protein